jgi:hypothetical protein
MTGTSSIRFIQAYKHGIPIHEEGRGHGFNGQQLQHAGFISSYFMGTKVNAQ